MEKGGIRLVVSRPGARRAPAASGEWRGESDTALRLSSHNSWLLPQLTFLCANISWAVVRGGPLSAEDFPDITLTSSSNRRLSLTGASRMTRLATRGSMLERRENLVLLSEYESRRRGFPGLCCAVAMSIMHSTSTEAA